MFTHQHRMVRFALILLLVLALSAVASISAQSTLTQVVQTADWQISVHLPQGWLEQDTTNPYYSSVLAFGDSSTSLQAAVDSMSRTQTTPIPGVDGDIGILSAQSTSGVSASTAVATLLNTLVTGIQSEGGQVLEQQTVTIGGQYPGVIITGAIPALQVKGLFGLFTAGTNYVVFSMGASPAADFDSNSQMFMDIVNSIRVPGEGEGITATAEAASTQAASTQAQGTAISSLSNVFSVVLPDGWANQSTEGTAPFGDMLVFGSDQTTLMSMFNIVVMGQKLSNFQGVGGMIAVIDPTQVAGAPLGQLLTPFLQKVTELATSAGAQVQGQPQSHTFGGQYPGMMVKLDVGYLAVMHSEKRLLIAVVLSEDTQTNADAMNAILESIRMPPESGGQSATPEATAAS